MKNGKFDPAQSARDLVTASLRWSEITHVDDNLILARKNSEERRGEFSEAERLLADGIEARGLLHAKENESIHDLPPV